MTPAQCYEYFRKLKEKNPKKNTTRKKKPEVWELFAEEYQFMAVEGYYRSNYKAALRRRAVTLIDKYSQCGSSFDAFIPYLAVNYFDRFLSRHQDPPNVEGNAKKNLKLLAICCLLLAWKLRSKTFSVTEFLRSRALDVPNMSEKIMTMELKILDTLEWRMRSLTAIPFTEYFFPYFVVKDDVKRVQEFSRRRILQAVVKVQGDMKFTKFKPSTIAASAILCASFQSHPAIFHWFVKRLFAFPYVDKDLSLWLCTSEMGIPKEAGIMIKQAITTVQARQREAMVKAKIKEDAKKARAKAKAKARAKARAKALAEAQRKKSEAAKALAEAQRKKWEAVKAKGTKMETGKEIKKETKTEEAKAKEGTKMEEAKAKGGAKTEEAKAKEGTKLEEARAKANEGTKVEEAKGGPKMEKAKAQAGAKTEEAKAKEGTKLEEARAKTKEGTKMEEAKVKGGPKMEEAKETKKETKMEQAKEIKKAIEMEQAREIKKTVEDIRNKGKEKIFEQPKPKGPKSYGNIIRSQGGIIIKSEMREKMEKEKMMQCKPKAPTEVPIKAKEAEGAKGTKKAEEEDVSKKAKGEEKTAGEPKPKVAKEPIRTKQAEEAQRIRKAKEEEARRKAKGKEKMVEEPEPKVPKIAKSARGPLGFVKGWPGSKPKPRRRIRPRRRGMPRIKVRKVKLATIDEEPSAEYFGEGEILFLDFPLNWPRVELGLDNPAEVQQLNIPNVGPDRQPQLQLQPQSQAQARPQPQSQPQPQPQPRPCCGFM